MITYPLLAQASACAWNKMMFVLLFYEPQINFMITVNMFRYSPARRHLLSNTSNSQLLIIHLVAVSGIRNLQSPAQGRRR
jgi:hypothetical protein